MRKMDWGRVSDFYPKCPGNVVRVNGQHDPQASKSWRSTGSVNLNMDTITDLHQLNREVSGIENS